MRSFLFTLVVCIVGFASMAQMLRPPDPPKLPTPQEAYHQILSARYFAFGGVGYAGVTSHGEVAYRSIAGRTNALVFFSNVFTNGNAQAKLYALCGIRQFSPGKFASYAELLRKSNPKVETMRGCIVRHEFATNLISRISKGYYDYQLTNSWW